MITDNSHPAIVKIDREIDKLQAALDAKLAERDALVEALMNEAREALRALSALRTKTVRSTTPQGERKPYTGRKRGVAPGSRPVKPTMFTDAQVQDMRELYAMGTSQAEIAKRYDTKQPVIWRIVNRHSYKYVGERSTNVNLSVVS